MKCTMDRTLRRAAAALLLLLGACAEHPAAPADAEPAAGGATLELVLAAPSGELPAESLVDLHFHRGDLAEAPRMMEVHLRLTGLTHIESEPLSAATAAGKQLVVQEQEGATLRVVLYATGNTSRLDSGPLARLRLHGAGGTVELLDRRPIFAPPEADAGVTLGAPLELGGGR